MRVQRPLVPSAGARRIRGQGMTEYIIIVALIAIAAIAAVSGFGGAVKSQFKGIAEGLAGDANTGAAEASTAAGAITTAPSDLKTYGD